MSTATPNIRSLLQTELASRRINHPHAIYSPTGILSCSVCHQQLKSQSLWDAHTRSPQHLTRLHALENHHSHGGQQQQQQQQQQGTRKRKAEEEEEEEGKDEERDGGEEVDRPQAERKRKKVGFVEKGVLENFFDEFSRGDDDEDGNSLEDAAPPPPPPPLPTTTMTTEQSKSDSPPLQAQPGPGPGPGPGLGPQIDESEWAAFETDIATTLISTSTNTNTVLTAPSTISAPAMPASSGDNDPASTDGLTRREAADEAADAEREEAARRLEEEFDTMHDLEKRVRRLRGRREELRIRSEGQEMERMVDESGERDAKGIGGARDDGDEEESDEVDEWDDWRFGHVTR